MPDYLITATDPDGERATRRVAADSAAAAYRRTEADGMTDIVLHTDDVSAAAMRSMPGAAGDLDPETLVAMRTMSPVGFFLLLLRQIAAGFWPVMAAAAAYLAVRILTADVGDPPPWRTIGGGLAIAALALPVALAAAVALFGSARRYDALIEAFCWGRWRRTIDLAEDLRGKISPLELDTRAGIARIMLGERKEGLEMVRRHLDRGDDPRWLVLGRLIEVYEKAEMFDESIAAAEEAHREAPDNPTVVLDHALALLKAERDLPTAQRLIAQVEAEPHAEDLGMFLPLVKGIAALNGGRSVEAIAELLDCRDRLKPYLAAIPIIREADDTAMAYLAIAYAQIGEHQTAEALAKPARRRLTAFGDRRLLARLDAAVG